MKTILAAFDNSPYSQSIASYACEFASPFNARIFGLHVVDTAHVRMLEHALESFAESEDPRVVDARKEDPLELLRRYMHDREEEFKASCNAAATRYTIEQQTGAPEREIARQALTVDLVIIGRHGMHGEGESEYGLGHVAHQIAMNAPKPTLVVPAVHKSILRPLVFFDGSAFAGHALRMVCDLCELSGAIPHLLTVAESELTGGPLLAAGERYLKRREIEYSSELRLGSSEGLILDAAKSISADLIALGGPHHSLLMRVIEHHTLDRVLEYAQCPVLVYR